MSLVFPGEEVSLSEPGRHFERHHHLHAYAALLVEGECQEIGDHGRFTAVPGDVLIHDRFDGHADQIGRRGARFLNIAFKRPLNGKFGRVFDVDAVVRAFERDPQEGLDQFHHQFQPVHHCPDDWPDLLATDLSTETAFRFDEWADARGVHPASLSRGFRLAYGVTPKRYRLEQMTARAARRMTSSSERLAAIATECGFADQSHMTRAVARLLGTTPARLRLLG